MHIKDGVKWPSRFTLPRYVTNLRREEKKYVSVPAESSHFLPIKKALYWQGQNVTFSGKI